MEQQMETPELKPFGLCGVVVHGYGRKMGRSATMQLTDEVIRQLQPYKNLVVYGWGCIVARPEREGVCEGPYPFAASIGFNPHFQDKELTVEVHFLHDFEEDFYGAVVKIITLGAIREMCAFASLEELLDAIKKDIEHTEKVLQTPEPQRYKTHPFLTSPHASSQLTPYLRQLSE